MAATTPTSRNAQWFFEGLWKPRVEPRLPLDIVDTVLVQDGVAARWLFTDKRGEVRVFVVGVAWSLAPSIGTSH